MGAASLVFGFVFSSIPNKERHILSPRAKGGEEASPGSKLEEGKVVKMQTQGLFEHALGARIERGWYRNIG
jgi:hypothetical protein